MLVWLALGTALANEVAIEGNVATVLTDEEGVEVYVASYADHDVTWADAEVAFHGGDDAMTGRFWQGAGGALISAIVDLVIAGGDPGPGGATTPGGPGGHWGVGPERSCDDLQWDIENAVANDQRELQRMHDTCEPYEIAPPEEIRPGPDGTVYESPSAACLRVITRAERAQQVMEDLVLEFESRCRG